MNDRKLGYLILLLLISLASGFTSYFLWLKYEPKDIRTVVFDNVGNLAIEDPVCINGVLMGHVRSMKHKDNKVYVKLESRDSFPIRTSSDIRLVVKGIMGDRFIEITSGDIGDPLVDENKILTGEFVMGPSEVLAYLDILRKTVTDLKDLMVLLHKGSGTQASLVEQFGHVTVSLDSLAESVVEVFTEIDQSINPSLDSAAVLIKKSTAFTSDLSKTVPQMVFMVDSLLIKTGKIIPVMDTFVTKSQKVASKFDKDNRVLWGNHLNEIRTQLISVNKAISELRAYGTDLHVKPKF
ncbi:MAG: MlaD family protein [Chitinispirillaceae bacterium]